MSAFPAVLVGGPPHSGKSVLLYAVSQALRDLGVAHYALRACPDGEGDWSQEAPPPEVRAIRIKGAWTPVWVDRLCRDIRNRHLPLLVDVGGRPTADQERLFDECTHAILLTKDEASHAEWQARLDHHALPLLADLTSRQEGESQVRSAAPILSGVIAGLERHAPVANPALDALTAVLSQLFAPYQDHLRRRHLDAAPVEMAVDLDRLAVTLGWARPGAKMIWLPAHLPVVLDYLPAATPLAIYGRAPNWLIAALARLTHPAAFFSFDVRSGWAQAQPLRFGLPGPQAPLAVRSNEDAAWLHVACSLPRDYIDHSQLDEAAVPLAPPAKGVILSGKIPNWLTASLALTYADAPWLAVYQPMLQQQAIVVSAGAAAAVYPVGQLIPCRVTDA